MRARRWVKVAAPWLAGAILLGACADDHPGGVTTGTTPPSSTAPPTSPAPATTAAPAASTPIATDAGVSVTLQQYRSDEVDHILGVQVTNTGAAPIHVTTLQLDWPGIATIAPSNVDYTVSPGVLVDLNIDYGDAVCSDPPQFVEPMPDDAIAVTAVTTDGESLRWPVDDVRGVLTRIHGLDCRRQAVEYQVDVAVGTTWTPNASGDAVSGELILTREHATGPATLTGISGSVLLNVDLAAGAPTEMDGDRLAIPIVITSTGFCTGHALADSKKTYDFQVTIDIGGTDASISVTPAAGDQPIVFEPVKVTCGLG